MRKTIWIAPAVLLIDLLTKVLAQQITSPVTLIPGIVGLRYAENTGMAFGILAGRSWLLGLLSLGMIALGWAILSRYQLGALSRVAAMLMLGGAAGNMLDRLFRGYVVDMIEVLFMDFAIFNVADAALTVGCLLMALSLLLCPHDWERKPSTDKEAA